MHSGAPTSDSQSAPIFKAAPWEASQGSSWRSMAISREGAAPTHPTACLQLLQHPLGSCAIPRSNTGAQANSACAARASHCPFRMSASQALDSGALSSHSCLPSLAPQANLAHKRRIHRDPRARTGSRPAHPNEHGPLALQSTPTFCATIHCNPSRQPASPQASTSAGPLHFRAGTCSQ